MQAALGFDVVVIGGGSAGCAVAYQLVTRGLRTCLVEAGPDYGSASSGRWPAELLDHTAFPRTHDWSYVALGRDRAPIPEPRARVVGGCSTHNQCAAVWPLPADFDRWAATTGEEAWSYARVRPFLDQIEDATGGDDQHRGRGGLLPTRRYAGVELASWQRAFCEAATTAGFGPTDDLSSPKPADAVTTFQVNVRRSTRWNSAFAFLDPVRDAPKLKVVDRLLADRLVIRGRQAVALVCHDDGGYAVELTASSFVLSAGVYGTPAILLRSGIGPRAELRELGIPIVADLPGVGRNLHDHPGVALALEPSEEGIHALEDDVATGRLHQSQAALRIARPPLHVLPYHGRSQSGAWTFELLAFAMQPRSRGTVRLRDPAAGTPPRIDFGFLRNQADAQTLARALGLISALAGLPALRRLAREPRPLRLDIGTLAVTGYGHAVGTCRMGRRGDRHAVADASGRLLALANVSIGDASLIPQIPRANTNLASMLIGWRVGEWLAQDLALSRQRARE